jgi:ribA/ribD-fused uncharacterized protein
MTIFFWKHTHHTEGLKACLSNWYPSKFKCKNDIEYCNMEQWMMCKKAILFNDSEYVSKIMKETNPKIIKKYGRLIRDFDEKIWLENREQIVFDGCFLKFSQNPSLNHFLLSTNNNKLVEASPYDKIWGIGLNETDAKLIDCKRWPGQNLLGKCIMRVRQALVKNK